jgi:N-acetylneuraminic acid mutarotase
VIKSKLFVMGGAQDGPAIAVSQAYTLSTKAWSSLAPVPQVTAGASGAVYKGKLYCFGGATRDVGGTYIAATQIYTP